MWRGDVKYLTRVFRVLGEFRVLGLGFRVTSSIRILAMDHLPGPYPDPDCSSCLWLPTAVSVRNKA